MRTDYGMTDEELEALVSGAGGAAEDIAARRELRLKPLPLEPDLERQAQLARLKEGLRQDIAARGVGGARAPVDVETSELRQSVAPERVSAPVSDQEKIEAALAYSAQQAAGDRALASIGNRFRRSSALLRGEQPDEAGYRADLSDIDRRLAASTAGESARRAAEVEKLRRAEQLGLEYAKLASTKGHQAADLAMREKEALRKEAEAARKLELTGKRGAGGRASGSASAVGEKEKKLAQLPASEAASLGQYDAIPKMLEDLGADWDKMANQDWIPDSIMQFIPGTEAKRYGSARLASAQAVGTVLEGGKLTDSDLKDKYLPLMPSAGDTKETKQYKLSTLGKMAATKRAAAIKGFGEAGFDVGRFERPTPEDVAAARAGMPVAGSGKTAVRSTPSKDRKWLKVTYSDGTEEVRRAVP